jgi:hypothetical protein
MVGWLPASLNDLDIATRIQCGRKYDFLEQVLGHQA